MIIDTVATPQLVDQTMHLLISSIASYAATYVCSYNTAVSEVFTLAKKQKSDDILYYASVMYMTGYF